MKKVGVVAKLNRPEAIKIAGEVARWLSERSTQVVLEQNVAAMVGLSPGVTIEEMVDRVEMVVVLGGDGTLLSVARAVVEREVPILGVNLGGLGFLTEVSLADLYPVLEAVLAGRFETEGRMTLRAEAFRDSMSLGTYTVLNDAVINTGALARMIEMEAYVDGLFLTNLKADGLIISTPTGSTAYCLAAGGPIVHPSLSCITLTPICPHTLTNRPILVSDVAVIDVVLKTKARGAMLSLDGQVGVPLEEGDLIKVQKGKNAVYLIKNPMRDFFSVLREKLKWGQR